MAWVGERWGVAALGEVNFTMLLRMDQALGIYRAFKREIKDRSESDWNLITATLAVIEGWENG